MKSGQSREASKLLGGKKDIKKKQSQTADIGVIDGDGKDGKDGKEQNDSFEKHYNKDLDLDEGKHLNRASHSCRLSASCNLRAERERDQLHFSRELREGLDPLAEVTNNARPDIGRQEPKRPVCLSLDDAQHGALLLKAWRT